MAQIGKRYRRQDEIGTPYCITVDFDTIEKDKKSLFAIANDKTGKNRHRSNKGNYLTKKSKKKKTKDSLFTLLKGLFSDRIYRWKNVRPSKNKKLKMKAFFLKSLGIYKSKSVRCYFGSTWDYSWFMAYLTYP